MSPPGALPSVVQRAVFCVQREVRRKSGCEADARAPSLAIWTRKLRPQQKIFGADNSALTIFVGNTFGNFKLRQRRSTAPRLLQTRPTRATGRRALRRERAAGQHDELPTEAMPHIPLEADRMESRESLEESAAKSSVSVGRLQCKDDACKPSEQRRLVYCMSDEYRKAAPRMCANQTEPPTRRPCALSACPYHWVASAWSTCRLKQRRLGLQTIVDLFSARAAASAFIFDASSARRRRKNQRAHNRRPPTRRRCLRDCAWRSTSRRSRRCAH